MQNWKTHLIGAAITLAAVLAVALFYDRSIGLPPSFFGNAGYVEEVLA